MQPKQHIAPRSRQTRRPKVLTYTVRFIHLPPLNAERAQARDSKEARRPTGKSRVVLMLPIAR